jgi:hypothetical protein
MSAITIVLFIIIGLVLIYAAVKNVDPRDLVKQAVSKNT